METLNQFIEVQILRYFCCIGSWVENKHSSSISVVLNLPKAVTLSYSSSLELYGCEDPQP